MISVVFSKCKWESHKKVIQIAPDPLPNKKCARLGFFLAYFGRNVAPWKNINNYMTWSSRHSFLGLPSSKFISFLNIINLNIQIAQLITQCLFDVLRTFLSVDSFFLSEERKDDGWLLLQTSCSRRAHNKCSCAVCNYATFIAWAHHIKMFKILIVVSEQNWLQWRRQQAAVVSFDRLWNIKLTLSHK